MQRGKWPREQEEAEEGVGTGDNSLSSHTHIQAQEGKNTDRAKKHSSNVSAPIPAVGAPSSQRAQTHCRAASRFPFLSPCVLAENTGSGLELLLDTAVSKR